MTISVSGSLGGHGLTFPQNFKPLMQQDQSFQQILLFELPAASQGTKRLIAKEGCDLRGQVSSRIFDGLHDERAWVPIHVAVENGHLTVTPLGEDRPSYLVMAPGFSAQSVKFRQVNQFNEALTSGKRTDEGFIIPKAFGEAPFQVFLPGGKPIQPQQVSHALGPRFTPVTKAAVGNAVKITLDVPRPLQSIKTQTPGPVQVYRVDGDAVADKATLSLVRAMDVHAHSGRFDQSQGRLDPGKPARRSAQPNEDSSATGPKMKVQRREIKGKTKHRLVPTQAFTGEVFHLSGPRGTLSANHLHEVNLSAEPAAPRLGLAPADDLNNITYFWWGDGPSDRSQTPMDAGKAFAQALQNVVDEAPVDAPVAVALVMAADSPCTFRLDALKVDTFLRIDQFEDGSDKQVLTFDGTQQNTRTLPLPLPANAHIRAAELALKPSGLSPDEAVPVPQSATPAGLAVTETAWAAARYTPPTPQRVAGFAIALAPITAGKSLWLAAFQDVDGHPKGPQLAQTKISWPNEPLQLTWRWPEPRILDQPIWLLLRSEGGRAVWPTDPEQGGTLFLDGDTPADWRPRGFQQHHKAHCAPLPIAAQVGFSLNNQPLHLQPSDGGRYKVDLTTQLQTADPRVITITSAHPGSITLYPPTIDYTLP